MGLLVVPLGYLTVWELVRSTTAAFIAGVLLICGESSLRPVYVCMCRGFESHLRQLIFLRISNLGVLCCFVLLFV